MKHQEFAAPPFVLSAVIDHERTKAKRSIKDLRHHLLVLRGGTE